MNIVNNCRKATNVKQILNIVKSYNRQQLSYELSSLSGTLLPQSHKPQVDWDFSNDPLISSIRGGGLSVFGNADRNSSERIIQYSNIIINTAKKQQFTRFKKDDIIISACLLAINNKL